MIAIPQLRMAKLLSFMDDAAKPGGLDLMMYRACSALDKEPPSIEKWAGLARQENSYSADLPLHLRSRWSTRRWRRLTTPEKVDNAANDHEGGVVIAAFPTVEGNFRYAVDTEGYGALNFFNEEKLVLHLNWSARRCGRGFAEALGGSSPRTQRPSRQ
jgi:hypothetical protein